jgi:hypothetical protein
MFRTSEKAINDAADGGIISVAQAESLCAFLSVHQDSKSPFKLANVLHYFGGGIAIAAMTILFNLGQELLGGAGIIMMSLLYAAIAIHLTKKFEQKGFLVPAGICITFAVFLAPLAIYGLQLTMGVWPNGATYYDGYRQANLAMLYIEVGTLLAGLIALYKYRYPFLVMPIALTLWYMLMDIAGLLYGESAGFEQRATYSMYLGLLIITIAFYVDIRTNKNSSSADYAFWLYLFGAAAYWGAITVQSSDDERYKFGYFLANLSMILIGPIIKRKVFVVLGAVGITGYLSYLSFTLFDGSLLFVLSLVLIGLLIMKAGMYLERYGDLMAKRLRDYASWLT